MAVREIRARTKYVNSGQDRDLYLLGSLLCALIIVQVCDTVEGSEVHPSWGQYFRL